MAENFDRIKGNVEKMMEKNAQLSDIEGYLKLEGFTLERFKAASGSYKPE